jgi:predicted permease
MKIVYRLRALVRWVFRRDEIERALDMDLEDYIERSAAEKMRAGVSEQEARRAARIELGGVEQAKDSVRATLALGPLEKVVADVGYAIRTLRRQKTFTTVAVLTLALGIGVNVAIFSLFQQILLRPLPVPEPERLVNLTDPGPDLPAARTVSRSGGGDSVFSYPMFRDLERAQEPFVGIAAHKFFEVGLSPAAGEVSRPDTAAHVSGGYFSVLGLRAELGRLLGPQDDRIDGQAESVVLSHAYWQSELGANPDIVGRTLIVNGAPLTIVGVAPRGFHGTTVGERASVFVPITFDWVEDPTSSVPSHDDRQSHWVYLFARLAPGVEREEAEAAVNPLYGAILNEIEAPLYAGADEQALEQFRRKSLALEPGAHGQSFLLSGLPPFVAPLRDRLQLLLAVSGAVLLLCCANVAGLMLVRGAARTGEIAVRVSMGATRARLASLLFAESLMLALPAAVLSLPVALLTLRGVAAGSTGIPAAAFDADLDLGAALAAIGVAVGSALAFGLVPARRLLRTDPGRTLQAYGARQTVTKGVTRFRTALATTQIALSMALLAVTFVFAQSLANIARIDLGFDVRSLVMFSISPQTSGYPPEASAQLLERLEDELSAMPGAISAGSSESPLLGGFIRFAGAAADGPEGAVQGPVHVQYVGSGFFRTLGMVLVAGRGFGDADRAGAPAVAIVNQRFAERFRLGRDAVGQRVSVRGVDVTIVGLAADARYEAVTGEIQPQVFLPRRQSTEFGSASFYVRSARPREDLMSAVRQAAARVDPVVPVTSLRTMEEQLGASLATERFVAGTSGAFALLATVLAGLGLYGVLAYSVAQRSREIGLRVALGAPTDRIRWMVLRQVVGMTVIGIVLGGVAAWILGRAARTLLFGVEAGDPLMLAAAVVVLAAVALGAAYLPARRASRVDPMRALRYE